MLNGISHLPQEECRFVAEISHSEEERCGSAVGSWRSIPGDDVKVYAYTYTCYALCMIILRINYMYVCMCVYVCLYVCM